MTVQADAVANLWVAPDGDLSVKPVISPDGKWIAFQTSVDQPLSGPRLGIVRFGGGQPLKLLDVKLTQYRWSADSKAILYLDNNEGV